MRSSADRSALGRDVTLGAVGSDDDFAGPRLTELEEAVTRTLPVDDHDASIEQPWVVGVPIVDGGFHIPLRAREEHFPAAGAAESGAGAFDARQSIDALLAVRQQYRGTAEEDLTY
jgi:hypothetical protein